MDNPPAEKMSTRSTRSKRNKTQEEESEEAQGSIRSSAKETPSTVQSGSTEQTESSEQTNTTDTTETEQSGKSRMLKNKKEVRKSRDGTVVNRPARGAARSVASSTSVRRRAALEARLELERSQKEKADAAIAMARTKLELIELREEEDSSDLSSVDNDAYVSDWVNKSLKEKSIQEQGKCLRKKKMPTEKGEDATTLASAIMNAIKSIKEKPTHAPKYINELHQFDGNPREWIAFKAIYRDTEQYFSDIENVARLRRAIKDQARESVKSLLYTNTNPREILEALERRFGRPTHLIKSEIAAIEKLSPMTNDIKGIGTFASAVANSVNVIKQMDRKDYLYSNDLSEKIIDKMNMNVKFRWYEYRSDKEEQPILISLTTFLNKIADQFEAYDTSSTEFIKRKREPFRSHPPRNQRVNATNAQYDSESDESQEENEYDSDDLEYERERAMMLNETPEKDVVLATTNEKQQPIACPVCRKEHSLTKCVQFQNETIKNRWDIVKKIKVCFKCLKSNHRHSSCKAKPCGENKCTGRHHALLHETLPPKKEEPKSASVNHISTTRAYLKIVPVEIYGPQGTQTVAALLDEGSTVTLLLNEVADQIGAKGPTENLSIEGVSGQVMKTNSRHLKLRVKGMFARNYEDMRAYTIDRLNLTSQSIQQEDIEGCVYLHDIQDQIQYENMKPALLIGQDNWHLIVTRELKAGNNNQPAASLTKLGWILHGCRTDAPKRVSFVGHMYKKQDEIENLIKSHFDLDSLGIAPKKPTSDPEQRALAILDETTKRLPDGRFECGLLWRSDNETMPNNRANALHRLIGIEKKMAKNDEFKKNYSSHIQNLLASGYAEPAACQPTTPRTWYLPHFAVVHPQKGKMRLVFDAAARTNGKSLNDALLSGPDLLQSLFGVLIRFRGGPIAVAADIKEMFLRVSMREEDRDSLRFLWREKETDAEPSEYRMKSLIFGATSSPCSAIYVKDKNAKEFEDEHPDAVYAVRKCHYMDDYLQSFQTIAEARTTAEQVDHIHRSGGFVLRGWASNESEVVNNFEENEKKDHILLGQDQTEKTLGMLWNVKKDVMQYTLNLRNTPSEIKEGTRSPTKREVTSAVMSVFDPLGLAAPVLIQGKRLIQQLWRAGTDWDDRIPDTLNENWSNWLRSLESLENLDIPRCTYSCEEGELHTFVDASETSYVAASYWRTMKNNQISVMLLAAKAKVTPLKPVSIPRLELQAALTGARLAASLEKEIPANITQRYFWSDSRTVLAWIKSDPRTFKPFVAHRLAEIEESTKPTEWRWIPTHENVADDSTRSAPRDFTVHHRWFSGPSFLYSDPSLWPENKNEQPVSDTGEKKTKIVATVKRIESSLPDVSRFSSWKRLLRATARFLQSIDIFKEKLRKIPETVTAIQKTVKDASWRRYNKKHKKAIANAPTVTTRTVPLPEKYLRIAETLLVKTVQQESWRNELKALQNDKNPNEKDSRLKRLTLKLKGDVIHIETRISSADCVSDTYKEPIVLDGKHPITKLLIQQYHIDYNHANHNTVMNEIRQKYYVTSLRNALKAITRECGWCRTHKNSPTIIPTGDLPPERLQQYQPPFTCTGVDYFGPLTITSGRKQEKRWVALYTCLTTRAVHLEIVPSLSADSMILSLRRMISRRGAPSIMYSDNGTNFVSADKEMKTEFQKLSDEADRRCIRWKFIPAGAPNMGGAWERMVRSVKVALTATLKTRQPREEILHTLLLEAEHMINSRPLTHVSLDPNDEESLTPNHFLIGRSSGNVAMGRFDDRDLVGPATWKTVQRLADKFWYRWLTEYLPTLIPKYSTGATVFINPQVGDVVLIVDSSLPRGVWPKGQIIRTYTGPDGKVRVVDVRTTAGELRRPTSRIIKIA